MIPVRLAIGNHGVLLCKLPVYLPSCFQKSLITIRLFGQQNVLFSFNFTSEIRLLGVLLLKIDDTYSLGMLRGV